MGKKGYNKVEITWMVKLKHKTSKLRAIEVGVSAVTKAEALQEARSCWGDIYNILGVRRAFNE